MSPRLEQRMLRKRLLLARSTLYRVEMTRALFGLTDRLGHLGGGGPGSSSSIRGWLVNLFLRRIASAPVARLLGLVSGALAFAQVLRLGSSIVRGGRRAPAPDAGPVVERGSAV